MKRWLTGSAKATFLVMVGLLLAGGTIAVAAVSGQSVTVCVTKPGSTERYRS
jgi:hypothetical protein